MRFFRRSDDPRAFAVAMIGLKMGDRLLQIGAGDGRLLAALGTKVGLTGRACGVDATDDGVARARVAAEREGVLLELQRSPNAPLPFEDAAFDVAILHDVLRDSTPEARVAAVAEAARVLRRGGRCIVLDPAPRGGLGALFGGPALDPSYKPEDLLRSGGFKAVRTLAEREGLRFVEGVRSPAGSTAG